jgi:hypothetical protein
MPLADTEASMTPDDDPTQSDRLADLHAHLQATAVRPIEAPASRWLGEAEAVAGDAATMTEENDPDEETIAERVGHVRELLSNVDETGDPDADDHVAAAREEADVILDRLDADPRDAADS